MIKVLKDGSVFVGREQDIPAEKPEAPAPEAEQKPVKKTVRKTAKK